MNRNDILNCRDLKTDTFEVPEWGTITIRRLDGAGREELEFAIAAAQNNRPNQKRSSIRALAAVLSIVGDDGELLFTQADVSALAKKSGVCLDLVMDKVLTLNGMSKAATEDIEKN